jgi:lysophospholipase L1-like esterase
VERHNIDTLKGGRNLNTLRRKVGAAFVALGLLASSGCIEYEGNPEGPRVAIAGDSMTGLAIDEIEAKFHPELQTVIDAQNGQRIDQMLAEIEAMVTNPLGKPDVMILALGTNDMIQENPNWRESLDQMIALVADIECVVLVGVNEATDRSRGNNTLVSEGLNSALDDLAASNPDKYKRAHWLEKYDWEEEWIAQNPDGPHYFSFFYVSPDFPDGIWIGDGIHESLEGQVVLAQDMYDGVKQCSNLGSQ